MGTAIGLFKGRMKADDKAFDGLGNLNRAGEVSVFAEAEWGAAESDAAVVTMVGSGAGRTTVKLGADFENELNDRLSYKVKVSTIFGNEAYSKALYGVSAVQATRSGHAAFSPGAGFSQASVDLSMRYAITENWFARWPGSASARCSVMPGSRRS